MTPEEARRKAEDRARRRLIEQARKARTATDATFPTSTAGGLHVPKPSRRAGAPVTGGTGVELTLGIPPIGEIIRLEVGADIGGGNEPVNYSSVLYRNGFSAFTAPGSQITLPYSAIYGMTGGIRWTDGFTGGGTVGLYLDDVLVADAIVGYMTSWNRFPLGFQFDGNAGQRFALKVNHSDTDHTLGGVVELSTKEPLRQAAAVTPEFVDSVDANSGSGSGTIDVSPLGAESGDLLLAFGSQLGVGSSSTTLDGFTLVHHLAPTGFNQAVAMLSKTATGSEGVLNWAWPGSGGGATMWVVRVTSGTVLQTATKESAAAMNHTTPDVGDIASGQLVFMLLGKKTAVSITTAPSPATPIPAASTPNGALYRDDTPGTSVRSFAFNGTSESPMISARIG